MKRTEQWAQQIINVMASYIRPRSVADANALIASHHEKLVEIDLRQKDMAEIRELGQKVIAEQPDHRAEIQRAHRRLQNNEHQTRQRWEQEKSALQKALELQVRGFRNFFD